MRFAVLSENKLFVENIIVAREAQKEEMEKALNRTLMDAAPLGMSIGDFYNGTAWTRNIDGEQIVLPIDDNYAVAEAIAILEGAETL